MKLGRTPRELLEGHNSMEIAELFAFHALLMDEEKAQKEQGDMDKMLQTIGEAPRG